MSAGTAPRHPSVRLPRTRNALSVLAAILLVASAAAAGVLVNYNTASTATFDLKGPPIVWSAGPDSSGNDFVSSWTLSSNATYWTLTMKPVPEATVTWENLTTLSNVDEAPYVVRVSSTDLSSYAKIITARVEFYAYGTDALVGTLDLKQGANAELGTMPAGAQYYTKAIITLGEGAGQQHLPSGITLTVTMTP